MAHADLVPLVEALSSARVLCVGDVMLDRFVHGRVDRISPEAPVQVLRIEGEEARLGGAGNVLRNLHALGAQCCFVSVIGGDREGRDVSGMVAELDGAEAHLVTERSRVTTVKTRFIAETQQLLRADRERSAALPAELRRELVDLVRQSLDHYQVAVVSDYGKGALGGGAAAEIIAAVRAAGGVAVVDPKLPDYAAYRGANIIKPNRRELGAAARLPVETAEQVVAAARALIAAQGFGAVLATLGRDGMILVEASGATHSFPVAAREVFDVSGAGDTVAAVLAAALGAGAALPEAARLANVAAGIVVGKIGTAVVRRTELEEALVDRDTIEGRKVFPLPLALEHVARWRRSGLSVGFTNGCFDLLHPGHTSLLQQARNACDRLVVGLNSDASVRRLKGPARPVQNEAARAAVLASLATVDLVVLFDEDTPEALIAAIRPDVLVKGADYRIDQVVGGALVQSYGGRVLLADLLPGHSTTATIARAAR
jgi:D-beta-D-heptose 7-phosphate kinase / D-beta-D-heptose 1-phosphate adenosyltransferase